MKLSAARFFGSALIYGARLCEPQHVVLQITRLRVTDPRSESKLGHCRFFLLLAVLGSLVFIAGCSSVEPENASARPWNSPTSWQNGGALNGMDYQHR